MELVIFLIFKFKHSPFLLAINPLIAAIAAGNICLLKPSEISSHTTAYLTRFIHTIINIPEIRVINGGVNETTALLKERFDMIFYTGSSNVGKIIQCAASKYLTPTLLELGGKCPVVIDAECNITIAAKRVMWAKTLNAGQVSQSALALNIRSVLRLTTSFAIHHASKNSLRRAKSPQKNSLVKM